MKRTRHQASGHKPRKVACAACRSRRIRCNKVTPCSNCMIRGLRCLPVASATNSSVSSSPPAILDVGTAITSPESSTRKAGFYRFLRTLDGYLPAVPYIQPVYFWRHGVIPATQSNDALMNAVLCKEIINKMPKEQLMSAALPAKAIEYYVESLCRPFTKLEDLPLLLMITIMYIEIEMMLSHYKNLDILVHSTLEIIYSNRKMLLERYRRDRLLFVILAEFMRLSCETPVDSSMMPLHLWTETCNLATKIGMEISIDGLVLLELRMYDIQFRLSRSDFDDPSFGYKFISWEHNMAQYERGMKPGSRDMKRLEHMRNRNLPTKIFWNSYHYHLHGNIFCGQDLRASIELQTRRLEGLLANSWVQSPGMKNNPLMYVQVFLYIIPKAAFTIYYARDKAICHRIVKVLHAFRDWISYYDDLVDYLETATETEFGYRTALEVAYFGPNLPLLLTKWQVNRLVDQVATHGFTEILRSKSLPSPLVDFTTE